MVKPMIPNPVKYVVYDGLMLTLTLSFNQAYGYALAGNGVFKFAAQRHFRAVIPVAPVRIAGLPQIRPHVTLRGPRLPEAPLLTLLQDARKQAWDAPREAMYHLRMETPDVVTLTRPEQTGTAAHLAYAGGEGSDVIADVHSHCEASAFFSPTDNGDELGFRFYVVIGRIFTRPEIRCRVGVYGDRWDVPITTLFAGPGPFRDTIEAEHG